MQHDPARFKRYLTNSLELLLCWMAVGADLTPGRRDLVRLVLGPKCLNPAGLRDACSGEWDDAAL